MDEVNIQKQIGELAVKISESEGKILKNVSDMLERALRRTEENIAQGYQLKTSEAISIALKALEEDSDGKYAAKWVETGFKWLLAGIGAILIGWVTDLWSFIIELFYKAK